jgi:hypothetical protein
MKPKYLAAAAALVVAGGVHATSATFDFNLPAVGNNAVSPPYPTVATLTLVDVAGGVQFTLDPNESSSGFAGDASSEFVERLTLAYVGTEPLSFSNVAGAELRAFSFDAGGNLDAGYKSNGGELSFDWFSSPRDGADRFDVTETSTWSLFGAGLDVADFTTASATTNNKPGPIHGVISVTGYDLDGVQPTPSNWVDGAVAAPVPEPSTYALMLAGLGAVGFMARRRSLHAVNEG